MWVAFFLEQLKLDSAIFTSKGNKFGYLAHEFYDLRDAVIVFAIPRSVGWVEQVIPSGDQLENIEHTMVNNGPIRRHVGTGLITNATPHIFALVSHFAPM